MKKKIIYIRNNPSPLTCKFITLYIFHRDPNNLYPFHPFSPQDIQDNKSYPYQKTSFYLNYYYCYYYNSIHLPMQSPNDYKKVHYYYYYQFLINKYCFKYFDYYYLKISGFLMTKITVFILFIFQLFFLIYYYYHGRGQRVADIKINDRNFRQTNYYMLHYLNRLDFTVFQRIFFLVLGILIFFGILWVILAVGVLFGLRMWVFDWKIEEVLGCGGQGLWVQVFVGVGRRFGVVTIIHSVGYRFIILKQLLFIIF